MMSFNELGLSSPLLKAIEEQGYTTPSPIQTKSIPVILKGGDVLASAQTGTGKTAGFTLPLLENLTNKKVDTKSTKGKRPIRALILTPTRELAAQVHDNVQAYSKFLDIRSMVMFGGVNQKQHIHSLRGGIDILVSTPGRLLDLESQGYLSLANIETLILDEADRMLDMGFVHDIKKIIKLVPKKRQTLLFSATFSKEIKALAHDFLVNPVMVEATPENTTAQRVEHSLYRLDRTRKTELAVKLIKEGDWQQVLVFTRTKHGANRLSDKLEKAGITSAAIHGNKSQNARVAALRKFKDGGIRVLVATDIAARGLDIPLLPHVINFELPNVPEDYVHRIGRTGRAGASGNAVSLVGIDEEDYVFDIERLLKQTISEKTIEGFARSSTPTPEDREPPLSGGGRFGRNTPNKNRGSGRGKPAGGKAPGQNPKGHKPRNSNNPDEKPTYKRRPRRRK